MSNLANSKFETDDICRRGEEIFDAQIKSQVAHLDPELHVVIDVDSGEFAIGDDHLETADQMLAKNPAAELYHRHVGHSWSACFGGRPLKPGEVRVRRLNEGPLKSYR